MKPYLFLEIAVCKEISYHEEIQKLHDAYIEYVINELEQDQNQPNHVSGMIFERILK